MKSDKTICPPLIAKCVHMEISCDYTELLASHFRPSLSWTRLARSLSLS
jgi:hypothetical protein